MPEEKKQNTDEYIPKRNVNPELWKQVQEFAKSDKDKLKAVQLIFEQHYQLPEECIELIKKLSQKDQPKDIRLQVAKNLLHFEKIPFGMYGDLVEILLNDPEGEVKKTVMATEYFKLSESTRKYAEALSKSFQNSFLSISPALKSVIAYQNALNRALANSDLAKIAKGVTSIFDSIDIASISKQIVSMTSFSENVNKRLGRELLKNIPSYYQPAELQIIAKPPQITKEGRGSALIKKLQDCKAGIEQWSDYEDICKEILVYCFVPPLLDPLEQSKTEDDLHKRDLIFHIPHDTGEFWQYLIMKFGLAIIVECKNYQDKLNENTILISSKYLGNGKLTKFGLVITRRGLNEGGKKGQRESWSAEKLLICLTDEDLIKMIMLKENGEKPWMVIDNAIREFLQSL